MLLPFAEDANCRGSDSEQFFIHTGASSKPAKAICKGCRVKQECLDWAIEYRMVYGIWGGKTVKERRRATRELVAVGVREPGASVLGVAEEASAVTGT
ncbi:hypothetical protein LCGC14_0397210 [marine sediment metagenome]|uniref:4Fe-4S Wbl-type domain-containing protein n=1 Tax=marine sediment metagenome TaxID=412755 RepID=A0A0F9W6Y7_9ZZZZ